MIYPNISGINYESVVDGPGIRTTIYLSGCSHKCEGCHNPTTHRPDAGAPITKDMIDDISNYIKKKSYISGITLSGGDPLFNTAATINFMRSLRYRIWEIKDKLTIWLYTGYTWEELMSMYDTDEHLYEILKYTDVLVDGRFVQNLADKCLAFRGSSNQRIIDVQKSLKDKEIVYWKNEEIL